MTLPVCKRKRERKKNPAALEAEIKKLKQIRGDGERVGNEVCLRDKQTVNA